MQDVSVLAGDRRAQGDVESHRTLLSGDRERAAHPDRHGDGDAEEQRRAYPEMYK